MVIYYYSSVQVPFLNTYQESEMSRLFSDPAERFEAQRERCYLKTLLRWALPLNTLDLQAGPSLAKETLSIPRCARMFCPVPSCLSTYHQLLIAEHLSFTFLRRIKTVWFQAK